MSERSVPARLKLFLRVLAWRPGRAVEVAYWYLTRRRTRASNRLQAAAAASPFAYDAFVRTIEDEAGVIARARATIAAWTAPPLFSILMPLPHDADPAVIERAIAAVEQQCYPRWEVVVVQVGRPARIDRPGVRIVPQAARDDADAMVLALAAARGAFVVPWTIGTELAPTALFRLAEAVHGTPGATALYGDQDSIDRHDRRSEPWLKPVWNAELILALDFASRACAIEVERARAAVTAVRSGCPAYALLLAATAHDDAVVVHCPHIVAHVRQNYASDDLAARVATVSAQVATAGATATAGPFGTVTVRWPMPEPAPAVTILIPTRDHVDLLRACVDSVLEHTRYDNYTLIVIDNGSVEATTSAYLDRIGRDRRVTVLPYDKPYNYSAINNFAVAHAPGEYLCFLNNDTEIVAGDWLVELMRYAVRPTIGAVGAKLLYEDRSIQHAGVVMGLGNAAGHAHRGLPDGEAGYFAQAHAAHYASAVTAACMVVAKHKFAAVGGFDAEALQIAYNDVDLCLKLGRAGWRNVYAPQATLLHLESKSRGADLSPDHVARYMRELAVLQARWDTTTVVDPMHHGGLDRSSETYRFRL